MTVPDDDSPQLDRRTLISSAAGLAVSTAGLPVLGAEARKGAPTTAIRKDSTRTGARASFPYDSFRDWIAALDDHGLLMRVGRLDQDAYEVTALAYRLVDRFGWYGAPAVLADEVKIGGRWVKGPLLFNHQGHWKTEPLLLGLEPGNTTDRHGYRAAVDHFLGILEANGGKVPQIAPVTVDAGKAAVKEVILRGDAIDLTQFAFIQSNPGDGGRYITTGSVFTSDPELGMNFGTYRCQLRGPRLIGVNPEPGQRAWKMFMAQRERGEKLAKVSIVLGQDPMMWVVSGSALTKGMLDDELAITGGLRGRAVEVVRSETNDHMVPAHAEMVIEGEVPLQEPMLPEGPFGEMFGYLGRRKDENFWMRVTCVTHRRNPWILNQFTGVTPGFCRVPMDALALYRLRKVFPDVLALDSVGGATGWIVVTIDKKKRGQALEVGRRLAQTSISAKIIVVVDKDVDGTNLDEVMHIVGSRWQPSPAAEILDDMPGIPLDPSAVKTGRSSKIIIDATRQWPEEGGPPVYQELNRELLTRLAPAAIPQVDSRWERYLAGWKQGRCFPAAGD